MPELEILPADRGWARHSFLEFPYRLYAGNPCWVPSLRRDQKKLLNVRRHPFYRHAESRLFVARRGNEVVGRIAAFVDHNAPTEAGRRIGSFGFFESARDREAGIRMVEAAWQWLCERGMHIMRGPVNPSFNYSTGVLVDGFEDPPAIGTPYNPPYYDMLLADAGLRRAMDLLGFSLKPAQLRDAAARFGLLDAVTPGVRLRPYDSRQREREVRWIWELHGKAFAANYDYVPISLDEVRAIAIDIERYGDPRFMQFCEIEGQPVGMLVTFPDWNQALRVARGRLFPLGWWRIWRARAHITRMRIFLLGMALPQQGTGLAATYLGLLNHLGTFQDMDIEVSWIVESHQLMLRLLGLAGARAYKRWRVYERSSDVV
jgi:hypothetical protein